MFDRHDCKIKADVGGQPDRRFRCIGRCGCDVGAAVSMVNNGRLPLPTTIPFVMDLHPVRFLAFRQLKPRLIILSCCIVEILNKNQSLPRNQLEFDL